MIWGIKRNLAETRLPIEEWEWASSPISRHMISLMEKYRPLSKADISIELFRERDEYISGAHPLRAWQTNYLPDSGWNRWTHRPNHIHWQAGDHNTILKQPAVSDLARALRHAIDLNFNISESLQKS